MIFFRLYSKRSEIINNFNIANEDAINIHLPVNYVVKNNSRALIVWGAAMLTIAILALISSFQPDQYIGDLVGKGIIFFLFGSVGLTFLIKGLQEKH